MVDKEAIYNYTNDSLFLIVELAKKAKSNFNSQQSTENRDFKSGYLFAYYEIIALLQAQANVFDIPLDAICLGDIIPEVDLLVYPNRATTSKAT